METRSSKKALSEQTQAPKRIILKASRSSKQAESAEISPVDLLLMAADDEIPIDQIMVLRGSKAKPSSHADSLANSTKAMITAEMEKQYAALSFDSDPNLSTQARVFARYLFKSPDQVKHTKASWQRIAMEKVKTMSLGDILSEGGLAAVIKQSLIAVIKEQTDRTTKELNKDSTDIIKHLEEE